jgi:dTDP-4-amino-4,6-dideoxygalactose transaminase
MTTFPARYENQTRVPFVDLQAQFRPIADEVRSAIDGVLESSEFVLGETVESFERDFAAYCSREHCVGVSSGTAALHLALRALDIGPGDEVITVPNTFIATVWAISYVGATPVFVDVDDETYNMAVDTVEKKITDKTKAILPVHLYGHPADMDPIHELAQRNQLYVVEDASQAHGAEYRGRPAGSMSDVSCFSFYPGKNLGAYGDAGAVVTNDIRIAERVRQLRHHAQSERYVHSELGYNYRMDGIQGAVLNVKLRYLDEWTSDRRRVATAYAQGLTGLDALQLPIEASYAKHVYHIYAILLESEKTRHSLQEWLSEAGIETGRHYPIPVHLQKAYTWLGHSPGDFPVAESIAKRELSLPIYAELTEADLLRITDSILDWAD